MAKETPVCISMPPDVSLPLKDEFCHDVFPEDFKWGTSTSAYQVEGAWNADGKGECNWDRYCHANPERILDKKNGDIACDSYNKYQEDIKCLKSLGVNFYRISLSWSRILPTGKITSVNQAGIDYYNKLINEVRAEGIEVVVTIHHFDIPQVLDNEGGWVSESIITHFQDFADLCFKSFGDRVKLWMTINEPQVFLHETYESGDFPPGQKCPGRSCYIAGRNMLLAHARVWHLYDRKFRDRQQGMVGISLNSSWYVPKSNTVEDRETAERAVMFEIGWFLHPLLSSEGDYPSVMRLNVDKQSQREGLQKSRLPPFTAEEIQLLKGATDFIGLNHYFTKLIENGEPELPIPSYGHDIEAKITFDFYWPPAVKTVPWGFRMLLNWLKRQYNNPLIYITESGFGDKGDIHDQHRITYLQGYINEVLKAVKLDDCNVKGYSVWSLVDNFEWDFGYSMRYGLHSVDFDHPDRPRAEKDSAKFYREVIKSNGFPKKKSVP